MGRKGEAAECQKKLSEKMLEQVAVAAAEEGFHFQEKVVLKASYLPCQAEASREGIQQDCSPFQVAVSEKNEKLVQNPMLRFWRHRRTEYQLLEH